MARFCSLFSSSGGNSSYIGGSRGGVLIDVGACAKKIEEALNNIGVDPRSISAIFITHEHIDHIRGARVFARRYEIPVYASRGTLEAMEESGAVIPEMKTFEITDAGAEAAGIFVRPFRTSHDARESVGFAARTADGRRIAVATDMGKITDGVMEAILGADLVLLESNHDVGMLQNGPYPYSLKRRILSDFGHLSNASCADAAVKLFESGATRFVLGHLSRENNVPSLARETTRAAMLRVGAVENSDYLLSVAGDFNPPIAF